MEGFNLTPENSAKFAALVRRVVADPECTAYKNTHAVVNAWAVEPREGFVADEIGLNLLDGQIITDEAAAEIEWRGVIYVALCGRRRQAYPLVRVSGQTVLSGFHHTYTPGQWEDELSRAAAFIAESASMKARLAELHSGGQLRIAA